MNNPILYIVTVKNLKWRQIFFRFIRLYIRPRITDQYCDETPRKSECWIHFVLHDEKIDKHLNANFLNHPKKLNLPYDWNNKNLSKLWTYNLHYFEDLIANNAEEKRNLHVQLLARWVNDNPVGCDVGWDPYPTSLRIVNVLKAWLGGLQLNEELFKSVYLQASYLSNNLEKHLLGNHYFVNLKALLFAGIIYQNKRWLSIAEKGLLSEIPEQILSDGANFELSPMYHSLILVDMLDMVNIGKAYPTEVSDELMSLIKRNIPRMLKFMDSMAHPDKGVSFFNDSVNGIAPPKDSIEGYAAKLGFAIIAHDNEKPQVVDNIYSGYFCSVVGGSKLIFDASAIGPDYIPGHAHADTLSFELSIGAKRVFVNSGISQYALDEKRIKQRKTASHNTVEVDGKDSSKVWSSFRVAGRAKIVSRHIDLISDQGILLEASHNGYKSFYGGCIHTRKLTFNKNRLVVSDALHGTFRSAKSRFYIHPDLTISLEDNLLRIEGETFILRSNLKGKKVSLVDSFWYPEFGVEVPNKMLEIYFDKDLLNIEFVWAKH